MNLNFIIIYVNDIHTAKTFYTETLGLTVWEAQSSETFVSIRSEGGAIIGLQDRQAAKLPAKADQPGSVELSFEVADVDATWAEWQAKGVNLLTPVLPLPFGRYFMAKDPEGYYLSVYHFNQPAS